MQSDIHTTAQQIDTTDWKEIPVDYGRYRLDIRVPPNCVILGMKEVPLISDPRAAYEEAFDHPIGCPPIAEVIRNKKTGGGTHRRGDRLRHHAARPLPRGERPPPAAAGPAVIYFLFAAAFSAIEAGIEHILLHHSPGVGSGNLPPVAYLSSPRHC